MVKMAVPCPGEAPTAAVLSSAPGTDSSVWDPVPMSWRSPRRPDSSTVRRTLTFQIGPGKSHSMTPIWSTNQEALANVEALRYFADLPELAE